MIAMPWRFAPFLFFCLFLSACATNQIHTQLPSWVKKPPQSADALFAIGSGVSLYEAEQNARISLASQIKVSVSDKLETRAIVDGDFHRDYLDQQTDIRISNISLSHIKVTQQSQQGINWFVLVKLDKSALIKQQLVELEQNLQRINHVTVLRDAPSFRRWWRLRKLQPSAQSAYDDLALLQGLGAETPSTFKQTLNRYFNELRISQNFTSVDVIDHSHLSGLKEIIDKHLADHQIIRRAIRSDSTVIELTTATNAKKVGKDYFANTQLAVRLLDGHQVLAEVQLQEKGVSLGRKESAINTSQRRLLQKARETDIVKALLAQSQ